MSDQYLSDFRVSSWASWLLLSPCIRLCLRIFFLYQANHAFYRGAWCIYQFRKFVVLLQLWKTFCPCYPEFWSGASSYQFCNTYAGFTTTPSVPFSKDDWTSIYGRREVAAYFQLTDESTFLTSFPNPSHFFAPIALSNNVEPLSLYMLVFRLLYPHYKPAPLLSLLVTWIFPAFTRRTMEMIEGRGSPSWDISAFQHERTSSAVLFLGLSVWIFYNAYFYGSPLSASLG